MRRLKWKVQAENDLFDILDYIGHDNPDAAIELVQKIAPRLTACASARRCTVPAASVALVK